jgi:hypothetical protein
MYISSSLDLPRRHLLRSRQTRNYVLFLGPCTLLFSIRLCFLFSSVHLGLEIYLLSIFVALFPQSLLHVFFDLEILTFPLRFFFFSTKISPHAPYILLGNPHVLFFFFFSLSLSFVLLQGTNKNDSGLLHSACARVYVWGSMRDDSSELEGCSRSRIKIWEIDSIKVNHRSM